MPHTSPLAVIFDVDGVLVDSYHAHFESWRRMAESLGRDFSETLFLTTFGRVSREIIAEHWGAGCMADDEILKFDQKKEALYRDIVAADFPAMDGAAELIRDLHAAGFRLSLGSSGPPENVALAVERLGAEAYFHARVTGGDVTRGKPDPQVFLTAAERLGVPPALCAVVEDAPVGVSAANAAGMASIALVSTGHTADSVQHARLVVNSLRDLSPQRIRELIESRV